MNCIGPDGDRRTDDQPVQHLRTLRRDRRGAHIDVVEMDSRQQHRRRRRSRDHRGGSLFGSVGALQGYIVDEVHMLTKNAFNALLKTLEEPPAHVKFLFATTEVNKVPVTVLSRCQRFDLARFQRSSSPTISRPFARRKRWRSSPKRWR
jgi:DNA polymerase-3 subunit gamma/tau